MRVIFPHNPLHEKEADGPFSEEYEQLKELGIDCSLFDYDSLPFNEFKPKPAINEGDLILYRGWMLTPTKYENLSSMVDSKGAKMITTPCEFIRSHHLPGWYESVAEFTPETIFVENVELAISVAENSGWQEFFVKDYVKSNYNERGSIAKSPLEVDEIISLIREHRGEIEGGIALRKVENLAVETEVRFFVVKGKAFSPNDCYPSVINKIVEKHTAPFYSLDLIKNTDDEWRLIEIGDGQVSDRKNWDAELFCRAISAL